ncbi:MAG TPA: DUF2127 domain-containing protein [Candidatus Paceibacterota bacterium]|nr:DUF2127 domain-containing protein [Verrucomicrobiota bacterium]HRY50345.1 DUF2127 domain-containing protein [Candidatus Paceibacterota bacterium]
MHPPPCRSHESGPAHPGPEVGVVDDLDRQKLPTIEQPSEPKQRAPTLYGIILFKLGKGLLLLSLALGIYSLAGDDLATLFERMIRWIRLDPESAFFSGLAEKLDQITPTNIRWVAAGTFFYSLFSLIEGFGLAMRVSWAGWMAIGESAFFIPIELFDLHRHFTWTVFIILAVNIAIFWYLLQNRHRLFHHHHHH